MAQEAGTKCRIKNTKSPSSKIEPHISSGQHKKWYIIPVRVLVKHLTEKYEDKKCFPTTYKSELNGKKA